MLICFPAYELHLHNPWMLLFVTPKALTNLTCIVINKERTRQEQGAILQSTFKHETGSSLQEQQNLHPNWRIIIHLATFH